MKKILLLATTVLLLGACKGWVDDGAGDVDETVLGYNLMYYNTAQHELAMDPYRIAERLNVYLTECSWDLNSVQTTMHTALFGGATVTDGSNGVYTITYHSSTALSDEIREGVVVVTTGGVSLSDPGASWTVSTTNEEGYSLGSAQSIIKVNPGSYTVSCLAANKWSVAVAGLVSSAYDAEAEQTIKSDWTSIITIEQSEGDQTYDSWQGATYIVSITVDGAVMMFDTRKVSINTTTPIKYNPRVCGRKIVGDGEMTIWFTEYMSTSYTKATWLGTSITHCNPLIKILYNGKEKEY